MVAWNVYGAGADEILWRWRAGIGYLRYHADRMGNVTSVLDFAGNLTEQYTYDAFGQTTILSANNTPLLTSAIGNRIMFTGREYLSSIVSYDYRHRMCRPNIGRFLQMDPIGFDAGDMNLFRYCGYDPVDRSDPTGLIARVAEDRLWAMSCFFDGGNSFQGSWDEFNNRNNPAGVITLELRPAGDRNQHAVERKNSKGERMSGETVTDFKVLDPVGQRDGSWKVTALYIVDVYYMDAPGSKAGPKTMDHTYKQEWEHPHDMDTKFYRPALATVREMNARMKFESVRAAATALDRQLRGRFETEKAATHWRDNKLAPGNHTSPFNYEE